jgi:hypothetical protein
MQNESKDTLTLTIAEPIATSLYPMYSVVADTGAFVHALLRAEPGKKLIGVNEWLSYRDFAKILAEVFGKKIEFVNENPSFETGDADLDLDYGDMMGFWVEFGYDGGKVDKSVLKPAELGVPVELESVKEWIQKKDWEMV